jgi:four helix bundle protein
MNKIQSHKDLLVWQRSMDLVENVYRVARDLPDTERWGLISQMCRAAVSVPANIAEGYGRQATGDYRRFLLIARGSLLELETHVLLCQRLSYMGASEVGSVLAKIEEILKMLTALISKIH